MKIKVIDTYLDAEIVGEIRLLLSSAKDIDEAYFILSDYGLDPDYLDYFLPFI